MRKNSPTVLRYHLAVEQSFSHGDDLAVLPAQRIYRRHRRTGQGLSLSSRAVLNTPLEIARKMKRRRGQFSGPMERADRVGDGTLSDIRTPKANPLLLCREFPECFVRRAKPELLRYPRQRAYRKPGNS